VNILLFFTAGTDSTYILYNNLKKGYNVTPIYVYIVNCPQICDVEVQLAHELIELFQEEFPNQLEDLEIIENIRISEVPNRAPKIKQLPLWIMTSLYAQNTEYHDEVQLGYNKHDLDTTYLHKDYPNFEEDIQKMYQSFQPICKPLIKLTIPLINTSKAEIINGLPGKYLNKTVSCAYPVYDGTTITPCMECGQCYNRFNY
jgi:7-cyano-7-deazaguanine synthase in queuosine biosynthesis